MCLWNYDLWQIVLSIAHLVLVYAFIYTFLFAIKREVNISQYALVLLIIGALAMATCPIMGAFVRSSMPAMMRGNCPMMVAPAPAPTV